MHVDYSLQGAERGVAFEHLGQSADSLTANKAAPEAEKPNEISVSEHSHKTPTSDWSTSCWTRASPPCRLHRHRQCY